MADFDFLTTFFLDGAARAAVGDSYDPGFDMDAFKPWCDVVITPLLIGQNSEEIRITQQDPKLLLLFIPIQARLETGVLKIVREPAAAHEIPTAGEYEEQEESIGVPLIAETPELELPDGVHLAYHVAFGEMKIRGGRFRYDNFTFMAPTTATRVDIATVERVDTAPSTRNDVVVRMIPDDWDLDENGLVRFFANGIQLGPARQLPTAAWPSILGKPPVIASGATQAEARDAIGAEVAGATKTMDQISDAQTYVKDLARAVTQIAARAAIGAIGADELEAEVTAAVAADGTVASAAAAAADTAVDNKVDGLNLVEAEDITADDYLFAIVDSDDRVAVVIGVDGSTRIYKFDPASISEGSIETAQLSEVTQSQLVAPSVGSLLLGLSAASGYVWAVVDSLGRVALGVREDGKVIANLVEDSAPLPVPEVSGVSPTRKLWALNHTTGVRELVSDADDPRDAVSHDGVILFTDDTGRKVFNGEVIPAWPDRSTIACWGDSLVEIGGWTEELDMLLPASVVNLGGSGQTTEEVAIRQGGIDLTVTVAGGEIPASGSVSCSSAQDILVTASGTTWSQAGTLAGVAGTLSRADGDGFDTLTFTRTGSGSAVSVDEAVFVSGAAVAYESNPVIILAGRNDHWAAGVEADFAADVVAAYDAMIDRLRVYHKEFLILGTVTPTESKAGSFNWARMTTANQALKLKYGNRFLDLQGYMVNDCIYDLGITPTPTDVTAMANKTLPPSIMNPDLSHFSTAAGEAAAVNLIKPKLDELGWTL